MTLTVADISKLAFDAVEGAIDGVIMSATLKRPASQGDYDVDTGRYGEAIPAADLSGRGVIETAAALAKRYPAYVSGPDDTLIILTGFEVVPKSGWKVSMGGVERTIKQVGDIVGVGGLIEVVAA